MSEAFDPYYTWLAIPPGEQPPDYYRLLGLRPFEENKDAIANAAAQRMTHIRSQATSKNKTVAREMLNELSAAKTCLLNAEQRARYDQHLRQAIQRHKEDLAKQQQIGGVSLTLGQFLQQVRAEEGEQGVAEKVARRQWSWPMMAVVGGGVLCTVLMIALITALARRGSQTEVAQAELVFDWPADQREALTLFVDTTRLDMPATGALVCPCKPGRHEIVAVREGFETWSQEVVLRAGDKHEVWAAWVRKGGKPAAKQPAVAEQQPASQGGVSVAAAGPPKTLQEPAPAKPEPGPPAKELPVPAQPATPSVTPPAPEPPASTTPVTPQPPIPQPRRALPANDSQQEVVKQLNDVYKLQTLKTPEEKLRLAKELQQLSVKAQQNQAEQFVLLRTAMDLACDGGDAAMMLSAVDAIDASFTVDALEVKRRMLTKFAGDAEAKPRIESLVTASLAAIRQAVQAERYDVALDLTNQAYRICQKPAGQDWRKQTYDLRADIQRAADQWEGFQQALDTLKTKADDPAANGIVGRWYLEKKGDLERSLPHLAKGSDENLKRLASQELSAPPADAAEQIKLADGWWDAAQRTQETAGRAALLSRAGAWYQKARPQLTSTILQQKVDTRLKQIEPAGQPGSP